MNKLELGIIAVLIVAVGAIGIWGVNEHNNYLKVKEELDIIITEKVVAPERLDAMKLGDYFLVYHNNGTFTKVDYVAMENNEFIFFIEGLNNYVKVKLGATIMINPNQYVVDDYLAESKSIILRRVK